MEVAVAALIVKAEENAGLVTSGVFVQEIAGNGEVLSACVKVAAKERRGPGHGDEVVVVCHKLCRFLVVFDGSGGLCCSKLFYRGCYGV